VKRARALAWFSAVVIGGSPASKGTAMTPELEEFRQRIVAHARQVVGKAAKVESEASTNMSLIQPFLTTLGYDVANPDEVSPEHHADFSEKYQNKVDYAILHQGAPVIALESKRVGSPLKDDRGQLRSYFNACQTVKLGILTDGLKFEFYADSDKQNLMDDTAFLRFDFAEIAKDGAIDDNTLGGIAAIRSGLFNPEDVGAEAKRKLLFESIVETIKKFKSDPSDDFIRFILGSCDVGSKISKVTHKIVEVNREVVRSAMEAFVAQEALARFGYAPKDLVRAPQERQETPPVATNAPASVAPSPAEDESLLPSDGELDALNYARNRLFFLVRNEILFQEVQKLRYRKGKTSFRVYYEKPTVGSLFDYREQKDGKAVLQFPALSGIDVVYAVSPELDECLLKAFAKRVSEAGVVFDTPAPALRAIKGGQSGSPGA
jgi:hypothetical protein